MTWDLYLCGRHGKEGGDSQGHPGGHRFVVDPEGEPGGIIETFVIIFTIILSNIYPGAEIDISVSKLFFWFHKKSLGFGFEKNWFRKKSLGFGFEKNWYRKKVLVSVSENLVSEKKKSK